LVSLSDTPWARIIRSFRAGNTGKRKIVSNFDQQLNKIKTQDGFIAALDQSGGSTPKALGLYGITDEAWSNDDEMYGVVHAMRSRIVTSANFGGDRILGAILFENTMNRDVEGHLTADYLWNVKNVVPFLKVDKGLAEIENGVQIMNPNPGLGALLEQAKGKGIFGTKMRSVIKEANAEGITAITQQQFEVGKHIIDAGLVPIIEPEVDIHCAEKAAAEGLLKTEIMKSLDALADGELVMLKLTLPESDDLYADCINHANVLRVVALSGGYPREEANNRLARNSKMIASFSRALSEGLSAQQSNDDFDATLNESIESIFQASKT
jgi:fructose-bisphosphate aldolase class I